MAFIVQVAGIKSLEEALMILNQGVDYLGFPLGPGIRTPDLSLEASARVIAALPDPKAAIVIAYLDNARDLLSLVHSVGASRLQVHGDISVDELRKLREAAPHLWIMKSVIIGGAGLELQQTWKSVREWEPYVDWFLTDTFDRASGARGATGMTHDWNISRQIVGATRRPVMLAGGLNPGNVEEAIRSVGPAGVDAHTGLENSYGEKDQGKVQSFTFRARRTKQA